MLASQWNDSVFWQQGRRPITSFIVDCSYNNPVQALTPDCRRLRELFGGKEVLGGELKCKEPDINPWPGRPKRPYIERELYIHDTQTDLWYHCCEHRMQGAKFSTDAAVPRLPKNMGLGFLPVDLKAFGGPPKAPDMYEGPLMQCKMMQNLKHVQDDSGGRKAVNRLPGNPFAQLTPFGPVVRCEFDKSVALSKYAGGHKLGMAALGLADQETGGCVDIGPHHSATTQGKPYAVYELSAIPAMASLLPEWGKDITKQRSIMASFL